MNLKKLHNDIHEGALQLIAEHRVQLFAKAKSLCISEDEADELVIRTIDQAIRKIDTYTGDGDILSWMMAILVNLYNNDHRSPVVRGTKVVSTDELERWAGADWSTNEEILRHSDSEAIRAAIAGLDPKYNQVLMLRYYEEFSLKQIASILRLPIGTVSRRIHFAHRLLFGKLSAELGFVKKSLMLLAVILSCTFVFATAAIVMFPAFAPLRETIADWFSDDAVEDNREPKGSLGIAPATCVTSSNIDALPEVEGKLGISNASGNNPSDSRVELPMQMLSTTNENMVSRGKSTMKSMKKFAASTLAAAVTAMDAATGLAGSITWTGGAGDTDLSKPTNWGVGTLTGADNATIGVNNQTFTLDKNTSFSTMVLNSKVTAAAFDFSANPTNEIYLGATSGDAFKATGSSNMTLSFTGGVWRGTGDASFRAASDAYNNNSTTVFDGTVVTNFDTYTWGDHSKGSQRTELKNGAQAYVKHAYNYAAGSNAVLMVSGGSRLVATSYLRTAYQGSASAGTGYHKIIIEGEGTFVQAGDKGTSQSGLRIGDTYDHCSVIVSNRATLVAKGLVLSTHDNNLWASNAILKLSNYLYFSGVSNRVDMLDCDLTIGALTMNGSYGRCLIRGNRGSISLPVFSIDASTYGSRNEIEVWDAVTSTQGSFGSAPLGRGNVYRLMRTATVKTFIKNFAGSNHEINICGEGTTGGNIRYESGAAVTFGGGQTNCYLRLMNGVSYEVPNASYLFGYAKAEGHDNTIYVGTNATMSLLRFRTGNYGNRVIIDNGTFTTPEFSFDFANLTERAVSNSVVFAGTHPKFLYTLNATYSLPTTGGWYVFEIPPEGYEAPPLQVSKGLKIPDGAQIIIHADIDKLMHHFKNDVGMVPIMKGSSITVSEDKLKLMAKSFNQSGVRFIVQDNVLYLRVPVRGMTLIVR